MAVVSPLPVLLAIIKVNACTCWLEAVGDDARHVNVQPASALIANTGRAVMLNVVPVKPCT